MSAVEAAVAVADAYGVHCEKPVVLREAWHVLVHLWPSPVVGRVTSGAPGVDPADVELAVARHAARAGAPVVRPSDLLPPGPHHHGGHTLVFWHYLVQAGKLDATAAGRGLHTIHESLADYDGDLLPPAGRVEEVRAMLEPFAPSDDVELLCELASRELPEGQALHGDAHLFNCIQTPAGPIWHDLVDCWFDSDDVAARVGALRGVPLEDDFAAGSCPGSVACRRPSDLGVRGGSDRSPRAGA